MRFFACCTMIAMPVLLCSRLAADDDNHVFIQQFNTTSTIASTVPGDGDLNPYGVAVVPVTTGSLVKDRILVSNFNNSSNLQGTGSTIVQITSTGTLSVFATISASTLPGACPGGVGLSTALVALRSGFVVVGSLPAADGTPATAKANSAHLTINMIGWQHTCGVRQRSWG